MQILPLGITPHPHRATEALFGRRVRRTEQAWVIDARRARFKGIVFLLLGVVGVAVIRSLVGWMGDPVGRIVQIGAVSLVGLAALTMARLLVIGCDAGWGMSVLGMAAAVAMGDLAQHALAFTLLPVLAWVTGLLICLGVLADLLDLELPEAALVAFAVYGMKLFLRWTVFQS